MNKRERRIESSRMNSKVSTVEQSAPQKKVEYYKKVEKTTTKTVIQNGGKPQTQKYVSKTVIKKEGDKPEQVSTKVFRSNNRIDDTRKSKDRSSSATKTGYQATSKTVVETSKKVVSTSGSIKKEHQSNNRRQNQNAINKVKKNETYQKGNKERNTYSYSRKTEKAYTDFKNKDDFNILDDKYKNIVRIIIDERRKKDTNPKPYVLNERTSITLINKRKERTGEKVENYEYYESKNIKNPNKDSTVIHNRLGGPFYQLIDKNRRYSSQTEKIRSSNLKKSYNETDKRTKTVVTKTVSEEKYKRNNKSTYQKNKNTEVKKPYVPKRRFEQNKTEKIKKEQTTSHKKSIPPTQKKFEEKSEESYKRGKKIYNESGINKQNLNKNNEKNKHGQDNLDKVPNYCPIHGPHGKGKQNEEMEIKKEEKKTDYQYQMNTNINKNMNKGDEDNYKFHESRCVTEKVMNTNQNILRSEQNVLLNENQLLLQDTRNSMQGMQMGQYGQIIDQSGQEYAKLYIATGSVPVYSTVISQQVRGSNQVCHVCGNPYGQQQFINQRESMQINCPIHGQRLVYQ